jgi:hypothetical protein
MTDPDQRFDEMNLKLIEMRGEIRVAKFLALYALALAMLVMIAKLFGTH